jgi:hypothetical protein
LTLSFNEYEADQSLLMSQKDTRIVTLEAENKGKDKVILRLGISVAVMVLAWVGFAVIKIAMKL